MVAGLNQPRLTIQRKSRMFIHGSESCRGRHICDSGGNQKVFIPRRIPIAF